MARPGSAGLCWDLGIAGGGARECAIGSGIGVGGPGVTGSPGVLFFAGLGRSLFGWPISKPLGSGSSFFYFWASPPAGMISAGIGGFGADSGTVSGTGSGSGRPTRVFALAELFGISITKDRSAPLLPRTLVVVPGTTRSPGWVTGFSVFDAMISFPVASCEMIP